MQELFDIDRGATPLGWNGHYVNDAAKNPDGVVSDGSGTIFERCWWVFSHVTVIFRWRTTSAILLPTAWTPKHSLLK